MEDEVTLLQGFRDEGLVFFGGVALEGVEVIVREEGMYFLFVVVLVYHRQQPLYDNLELLMMGIAVPETC
jgi:hypothetical protein